MAANGLAPVSKGSNDGRVRMWVTADSGAAESVLPQDGLAEVDPQKSPLEGACYSVVSGSPIYSEGQKTVRGHTDDGKRAELIFHVCPIPQRLRD